MTNETVVMSESKPEPGIRFTRMVKCLGVARGDYKEAARIAGLCCSDDPGMVNVLRAAANFGELSDLVAKVYPAMGSCDDEGKEIVVDGTRYKAAVEKQNRVPVPDSTVFSEFVELLRLQTMVGRATQAVKIPFRTSVLGQDFTDRVHLVPKQHVALVTVTQTVLRDSSPAAELYVRNQMVQALAKRLDEAFQAEIGDETSPFYLADEGGIAVDVAFNLTPEHFEHDLAVVKVVRTIDWEVRQ